MPSFKKTSGGGIEYRGHTFPGFNKPIESSKPEKKKMVLAKEGDKVKLIHFGDSSMGHNYSAAARKSYMARSAGIKGKLCRKVAPKSNNITLPRRPSI